MNLDLNKTVREVVVEMPQATRVFEKLQIDYCCGGHTRVAEACAGAGVELTQLEQMLQEAPAPSTANELIDFQHSPLTKLIDHILNKHHGFTKAEISRLDTLLARVVAAHADRHPELLRVQKLFLQLCADLTPHMFREEVVLFPYIVELENAQTQNRPTPFAPFGTVNNPVRMMMMEHDTAGDVLRELRKITGAYSVPSDACISYRTLYQALAEFELDLHQHIHLENNILFPRAVEMEEALVCR
jgi:regulator of cell morphogenesis and NO signaling